MTTPREQFEDLVDAMTTTEGVTPPSPGGGFGSNALRYRKKVFAMFVRDRLVVKLPRDRVTALVASGDGIRFDANRGTPMREWLNVAPSTRLDWATLAAEALDFVRTATA